MNESKFMRGAWFTLALVIMVFVWGAVGMLYFFTLPTDGWWVKPAPDFGDSGFIYQQNLLGVSSALQPGDHVIAVEGISSEAEDLSALQDRWRVGETMRYTVERDGAQFDVNVPLVSWQFVPALIYWIQQSSGLGLVGMLLFLAIAALTFFKRPNDHAARALFLFAALFPALSPLVQTSQTSPTVLAAPVLNIMSIVTIFAAYSLLFPPTLLQFALVFPRPKPIVQRHPFIEYLPYVVGLAVIPCFLLQLYLVGYGWTIFSIVGAIAILIHSAFTMRDALSRAQLLWGLWGFVLGMVMFLSTYLDLFGLVSGVWADFTNGLTSLSYSVLGITLSVAILRYRLFDIGILIRRTVTYALVITLLLVIYFGSVIVLQCVFAGMVGGDSEIITVLSTLAIAALFVPLRNRVQSEIDKRFNRKKYDAQQVMEKFARTVRDETDLEKLTNELLNVVNETMQPKSVMLWLKQADYRQQTTDGGNSPSVVRRPWSGL